MRLEVLTPNEVLLETPADKIRAEGVHGCFGILPRHLDTVIALVPCVLTVENGRHLDYLALDEGVLLKVGARVTVAVLRAVHGQTLNSLEDEVKAMLARVEEQEKRTRSALTHLEFNLARRFLELDRV